MVKVNEYERQRLENIKRNDEMLAALKIHSKLTDLSAAKRQSPPSKSYKRSPVKKAKTETPVVLRRSLRTRGVKPDAATSNGLADNINYEKRASNTSRPTSFCLSRKSPREPLPVKMADAYAYDDGSECKLIETLSGIAKEYHISESGTGFTGSFNCKQECGSVKNETLHLKPENTDGSECKPVETISGIVMKSRISESGTGFTGSVNCKQECGSFKKETLQLKSENIDGSEFKPIATISGTVKKSHISESGTGFIGSVNCKQECGSVNMDTLQLKSENIARVVPGRIMNLCFYPTLDMQMVVVGNKYGNIGFWNVNSEKDDTGIYVFHPHPAPISGLVIDPSSITKMYSSCYDGFIRLMDVEKEVFDIVYSTDEGVYSMSLSPHDRCSLYMGEGKGVLNMLDLRSGQSMLSTNIHEYLITTLDFSSANGNIMATSSTDGTACIWDLRQLNARKPEPLKTVKHKRAVHSAYFSPTGKFLATTSLDDKVGLSSGANYEDTSMVYHNNNTSRWISKFRGIWGWDDSSIFIGNIKRGVDVISVAGKKTVATLESDLMSAIPCRFAAHPYNVGMLAGATAGGQVYIWTP